MQLPQPVVHLVALTLEEVHALGILLDKMPIFVEPFESVLEGIYDKIDPILTDAYGLFWDAQ